MSKFFACYQPGSSHSFVHLFVETIHSQSLTEQILLRSDYCHVTPPDRLPQVLVIAAVTVPWLIQAVTSFPGNEIIAFVPPDLDPMAVRLMAEGQIVDIVHTDRPARLPWAIKSRTLHTKETLAAGTPIQHISSTESPTDSPLAQSNISIEDQSDSLFHQTIESIPGILYRYQVFPDGSNRYEYISPGVQHLLGLEPEAVLKDPMVLQSRLLPDSARFLVQKRYQMLKNPADWSGEFEVFNHQGTKLTLQGHASPVRQPDGSLIWYGILINVTEKERLTEQLLENESIRRVFFENAPFRLGVIELTPDEDIQYILVNNHFARLCGKTPEEIIGKKTTALGTSQESLRKWVQAYRQAQSTGQLAKIDMVETDTNRWVQGIVAQIPSNSTLNPRFLFIIEDVTEHRQSIERLRLLESAVERANDVILITEAEPIDPPGPQIVYVNPAFERMTGYTAKEAIGNTPRMLQGPKTSDETRERIVRHLKEWRSVEVEILNYRKDGTEFWAELNIVPVADETGWYTHWVAIQRDITARKMAELALRESESRFRILADTAPVMIWVTNEAGQTTWFNRQWKEFTGKPLESHLGTGWKECLHPDDQGKLLGTCQQAALDQIKFQAECRLKRFDGQYRIMLDVGVPRFLETGQYVGHIGTCIDITDIKQAEAERGQVARLESLGTLAGGIAHDFNNMLTSMLGNISLARRAKSPVQLETRLTEAERAIGRAQYLTKQLLTFAKGGEPIKSQVNLQALVVETVTFCLRGSSVEPIFQFAPHLPLIDADPGQIGQVIQNLVINARDAMPVGGNLVVSASSITSPQDQSELLRLTFEDEGEGIPANILNRIFDPYYTTKPTGHGLGLAVVYSIVRQHGGTINVTSSQNKGTRFEILLPISPLVEETPEALSVPVAPEFENCRILVLDDDDGVREITLEMLYMIGIQATGASRGEQLVELYTQALHNSTPFDLLLLDLTIPGGKGGIWTLNELKKINPQIRAIVCSGYSQDPALAYPADFGFIGRLVKPFSIEELQAQIRQALTKDG